MNDIETPYVPTTTDADLKNLASKLLETNEESEENKESLPAMEKRTPGNSHSVNHEHIKKYLELQADLYRRAKEKQEKLQKIRNLERKLLQAKRRVADRIAKQSRKKNRGKK